MKHYATSRGGRGVKAHSFELIGKGVYTVAEAARLTRIPERRLHRWTQGYVHVVRGRRHRLPPAIAAKVKRVGGAPVLEFLDLIEARFLDAFRVQGVKWRTIHLAATRAAEILGTSHPFSSSRFYTDGRNILLGFVEELGDQALLDLVRDQLEFTKVVSQFLRSGLEYSGDHPSLWRPLPTREVVLDPKRSFGAPIVEREGVPTLTLARAVSVNGDVDSVAWWYEVSTSAVRDAVAFEHHLAA